ncbi:hypothetical protein [Lysinibacillus sphaericus]|uniref:hypothetical protein n=1 Tax=Lysinibacillus sphaericus TaxID=1421 RepID=UPI003D06E104
MDHVVIKSFIDKETGKGYNAGSTFTSTDAERVSFLAESGFIKVTNTEKEAPKRAPRKKASD